MAGNTSTKKKFSEINAPVATQGKPSKKASFGNKDAVYKGQVNDIAHETFAEPMNKAVSASIRGLGGTYNDIGESSGFIVDGYLDKQGTPYGEAAKFNFLPPGMDINNQANAEIHDMPLRKLTDESYPEDGWMPKPRDVSE